MKKPLMTIGCEELTNHRKLKIIALGMGMQSTAMYIMSSKNILPRVDYAIFADPGAEHPDTYKLLKDITEWAKKNNGIPIIKLNKSLYKDLLSNHKDTKHTSVPAFIENSDGKSSIIRRECTQHYKIDVVLKKIRELHGLKPRQRMRPTELWLGISVDEIERVKVSRQYNVENVYPLVDKRINRSDCKNLLSKYGFINVKKSACVFCPYTNDRDWKSMKINFPKEFAKAIKVDEAIRNNLYAVNNYIKTHKTKGYLHRSLKPLSEVNFKEDQEELFMCEEGYCGL
jgi:hypothetical protein